MYNYFSQEKGKRRQQKQQIQKQKHQSYLKWKESNNEKLIQKFIRRTKLALLKQNRGQMSIQKYHDPKYEPRKTNNKLNKGPPTFYFQDRSSKHRVNDTIEKNKNLDDVPFNARSSPTSHRYRQISTAKSIKFTAYDTTSRVMETVKNMNTNELQSSWNINLNGYNSKFYKSTNNSISKNKIRHILPSLNVKLNLKTLESVKNNINIGILRNTKICHNDPDVNSKKLQVKALNQTGKQNIKKATQCSPKVNFSSVHFNSQKSSLKLL